MSDHDEDVVNDRKKGTQDHDQLSPLRPLMDIITSVCKAFYHPHKNLSIDERVVARKSDTGITQYMKAKPTKWGFNLFVLADLSNGYTVDFSVYTWKTQFPSWTGLAYDSVMSLIKPAYLGTGYNLYIDNFYSSPRLFTDLYAIKISATGTYRDNRRDCPCTCLNGLTKKDARGAIRWIREGPLVFVKWMDTREVSVCSTVHLAYTGNTVERRGEDRRGDEERGEDRGGQGRRREEEAGEEETEQRSRQERKGEDVRGEKRKQERENTAGPSAAVEAGCAVSSCS